MLMEQHKQAGIWDAQLCHMCATLLLLLLVASSSWEATGGTPPFSKSYWELSWGPSSPGQLRSLKLSQLEPETASEMPLVNGKSPSARERAGWGMQCTLLESHLGLTEQQGPSGTTRRLPGTQALYHSIYFAVNGHYRNIQWWCSICRQNGSPAVLGGGSARQQPSLAPSATKQVQQSLSWSSPGASCTHGPYNSVYSIPCGSLE